MTLYSRRATLRTGLTGLAAFAMAPGLLLSRRSGASEAGLTIHGMPATPSVMLAHLVESGTLDGIAGKTTFRVWRTPDEMRAGVASGTMAVTAAPSYAAANMYNRGLPVRLLNVMTWGLLYVVARDPSINAFADLAGKRVALAFKNDMPDLVFRHVVAKSGMVLAKDMDVQYVATPMEAIQLLLAGKVQAALASEPAATAAVMRGMQAGVEVRRAVDLQQEWARVTGRSPRIPQAGLAVSADIVEKRPELVVALQNALETARAWVANNPSSAARIGAGYLDLKAPIIERSIATSNLAATPAAAAREELEFLFSTLAADNPGIIGGKLPDSAFYLG